MRSPFITALGRRFSPSRLLIDAAELSGFQAESVLVGGQRTMVGGATDVTVTAEVSADLVTWNSGATYVDTVSDTTNNGIRTLVLRDHTPLTAGTRRFIRLRVTGS